jgi:nicotinamide phosphoribosyltransferase
VEKSPTEMDADGNITSSFKKSKAGRLKLIKVDGTFKTVNEDDLPAAEDLLQTVFKNGELINTVSFEQVKANVNAD